MPLPSPLRLLFLTAEPEPTVPGCVRELAPLGIRVESEVVASLPEVATRPRPHVLLVDTTLQPATAECVAPLREAAGHGVPLIFFGGEPNLVVLSSLLQAGAAEWIPSFDSLRIAAAVVRALRQAEDERRHALDLRTIAASERRFAALFHHSPIPTVITSLEDGTLVDLNPACEAMIGLPRRELINRNALEFGFWTDADQRRRMIADALAGGRTHAIERHIQFDGRAPVTVLVTFCAFELEGRTRLLVLMQDITARQAAEQTLRESEQRHRLVVENSHDLICEIDDEHRFCYASPNHLAVTGYLPADLLGRPLLEFIHPDDHAEIATQFDAQPGRADLRVRLRHLRGHWLTLQCAAQAYIAVDGSRRAVVVCRDITAALEADVTRHTLELQLRQAQKMEAIGTLAGGIAHDFNNILTAIFGYLQLVQLETPDDSPVREELAGALEASERARDLVGQILTFSRRREQQRALGQIAPVIRDALRLLRASLPATIEFRVEIDESAPPILCDPTQLHQVLMNLGTNAGHAMRDHGGRLEVRLTRGAADASLFASYPQLAKRETVCLTVSDSGVGMDAATRERIFEPFFTTKPSNEGTGLGLAVVHGIMQDHDGAVMCDSTPGVGTVFRLYFPTVDLASLDVAVAPRDLPAGQGQRVLLVDDEASVVAIGSRMIRRLGYHVESFTDARTALDRFTAAPQEFDIVVTDLTMGGATGVDIARRVFELRPGLPIIIATGFMNARDVDTARALGVKRFLEKPFSFAALAEHLAHGLERAAAA